MRKSSPCHGCVPPKRNPGCHSCCKEYNDWKEAERIRKEAEQKLREQEADIYRSYKPRRR